MVTVSCYDNFFNGFLHWLYHVCKVQVPDFENVTYCVMLQELLSKSICSGYFCMEIWKYDVLVLFVIQYLYTPRRLEHCNFI